MEAALMRERLLALLSTIFGGLAALLAAIGLYGVILCSVVSRRAQAIGVRMALGALPRRVLGLVLGETLVLAGLGIACGLPSALAATRLLAGFLYGVKPADPTVLLASAGFLVLPAAIAEYILARRAAGIDPIVALREE